MRIILTILLLVPYASAGMIEVIEDDPHQYINFNNWNPAIDSLRISVSLDLDSGFWEIPSALNNVTSSELFEYINPNYDGDANVEPGHYTGEYWVIITAYINDEAIPSGDTSHVTVDYTVSVPIDFGKRWYGENSFSMSLGGGFPNYKDAEGWHEVDNTIVNNAGVYECSTANLRVSVTEDGVSSVTFTWLNGVDYTVTQEVIGLRWYRLSDSAWINIDNTPNWNNLTAPNNHSLKWTGIFPAVDYELIKLTGSVAYKISLRPPFLDSMVVLYDQREDSSDIYLANIMRYTLSTNIDGYDVPMGNIRGRILKQFGDIVFQLAEQRLQFPGSDTLPEIPVWQRHDIISGNLYMAEFVKASHLKRIHLAYPTDNIWHNADFTIGGTAASLIDGVGLTASQPRHNYGAHSDLKVGDDFQPQVRTWHSLVRFNTLDDSMRNVGAATWDSAAIGLTVDALMESAESLCVTWHKVTNVLWEEGLSTGVENACGAVWDSANQVSAGGCAGTQSDWTVDGGDFSATRETNLNRPDSMWFSPDDWTADTDTAYFYISSATVSDTMGNKAGILFNDLQYVDADNDNTLIFHSDDQIHSRPFLQVWYTTGVVDSRKKKMIAIRR